MSKLGGSVYPIQHLKGGTGAVRWLGKTSYRAATLFLVCTLVLSFVIVPSDAASAASGSIRGRVADLEGTGLAGIEVTVWSIDQPDPVASVTTDNDGSFEVAGLAWGTYTVQATRPEEGIGQAWFEVRVTDAKPEAALDFILDGSAERGGVTGQLETDEGNDSQVTFYPWNPADGPFTHWWVVPDETGAFTIGLPEGKYSVEASVVVDREGTTELAHWRDVDVIRGQASRLAIALKAENPEYGVIHGQLATTDNGVRVNGVTVHSTGEEFRMWRMSYWGAAASSYRVPNLPPGEYLVSVHLTWTESEDWPSYEYSRRVHLGDRESLAVDFDRLAPPGVVKGRIVDESGNAVAGAAVTVYPESTGFDYGRGEYADNNGHFTFYLAEGKYELWFSADDPSLRQLYDVINVESGKTLDLGDLVFGKDGGGDGGDGSDGGDGGQGPEPGDRLVLDEDDLTELLQEDGDALHVRVRGTEVSLPASAANLFREAGKSGITFNFDSVAVAAPVADFDLEHLVDANPGLRPWLDKPGLELRFSLRPADPAVPKGLVAAGSGFEFTVSAYAEGQGEYAVSVLPASAQLVLHIRVDREADKSLMALWRVGGNSPMAVPSLVTGDGMLVATTLYPGTYLPALRRAAFQDTRGHWAEREITVAYSHGIINGKDATRFAPNDLVTRAEFAAMLVRTAGLEPDPAAAARFKDVPRNAWFAAVVGAAVKSGLVKGTSSTTFTPGAHITRLQLAVMIGRALKAQGFQLEEPADKVLARYRDAKDIGAWAREDLALAVQAGIVRGVNATTLAPQQNATRAQVAVMLVRYLEYVLNAGE